MRIDDDAFGRPALHRAKLWKMEILATHSSQPALASEARVHPSVGRFVNAVREARDAKA
jgi:hypothetical protein